MSEQESGSEHEVEEGIQEYEDEEETEPTTEPPAKKRKRAPLADADEFQKKMRKTGVLYISHMPPRMRPMHVRNLLQDYGTVLRVYCELEPEERWLARKKRGGNKKRLFKEAWVEFEKKKDAKQTAALLNGTQIGGSKKSAFYTYLWSMKYLKHFKWQNLTEEVKHKKREREKKLRTQIAKAKVEANTFLENQEKSILVRKIQARKAKKGGDGEGEEEEEIQEKEEKNKKVEEKEQDIGEIKLPHRKVLNPQKPRKIGTLDDSFLKELMGEKQEGGEADSEKQEDEGRKKVVQQQGKKRKRQE